MRYRCQRQPSFKVYLRTWKSRRTSHHYGENDGKVSYVGMTNDPVRRAGEHARDPRKQTNGVNWTMQVVMTGLTKQEARSLEQVLICIYTIDDLSNARYEIAQKNYGKFVQEFTRAGNIVGIPYADLLKIMGRTQ